MQQARFSSTKCYTISKHRNIFNMVTFSAEKMITYLKIYVSQRSFMRYITHMSWKHFKMIDIIQSACLFFTYDKVDGFTWRYESKSFIRIFYFRKDKVLISVKLESMRTSLPTPTVEHFCTMYHAPTYSFIYLLVMISFICLGDKRNALSLNILDSCSLHDFVEQHNIVYHKIYIISIYT